MFLSFDFHFFSYCKDFYRELRRRVTRWKEKDVNKLRLERERILDELRVAKRKFVEIGDLHVIQSQIKGNNF